jgi:hypothetical protein
MENMNVGWSIEGVLRGGSRVAKVEHPEISAAKRITLIALVEYTLVGSSQPTQPEHPRTSQSWAMWLR